ncbi:MAG: hypothetical protein JNL60_12315 [Bacteroidia bacterium]|nr:hypothetical protein [Bacteroidia bacterium]
MIFTVFQYVPILEEESPSHRVELAKKMNQDDTDGSGSGDADDDCDDDDSEDFFLNWNHSQEAFYTQLQTSYFHSLSLYKHLLGKKHTPPPEV